MVDQELLLDRLTLLVEYVDDLEKESGVTWDEFTKDKKLRRHIERTIHLAIECCLDIGNHIIAEEGLRQPRDYKDIFVVLTEAGILPATDRVTYEKMAGFRNILVHGYSRLDAALVFGVLKRDVIYLKRFAKIIKEKFLL